jgi:hypothetical protein
MKIHSIVLAGAALLAPPAVAANLTVVKVAAPAVNCVFNASCTVTVNDSVGKLTFSQLGDGAFFQSRTYPAVAGTPGAGNTAYEYRLDLRQANIFAECVAGLVLNFGTVTKLTYPQNQPGHVFVITQGGLGSVGIKSAEQDGSVITFTFEKYLCAGETSFFFGLAATGAPTAASATLFGPGSPGFIAINARVPTH